MVHELKIEPRFFVPVLTKQKTFEVRKHDRPFLVGDSLLLREWERSEYTGRTVLVRVVYLLTGWGIADGYCVMGIEIISENS